jgi:hypothetical protein
MAIFHVGDAMPKYAYFQGLCDQSSLALLTSTEDSAVFENRNGFQIVLHGSGFTFSSGRVTAGQVTSVEFLDENGGALIEVTGGNFAAFTTTLGLAPGEINLWTFMSALTAGNDEIHGSSVGNDLKLGTNEGKELIVASDGGSFMTGSIARTLPTEEPTGI